MSKTLKDQKELHIFKVEYKTCKEKIKRKKGKKKTNTNLNLKFLWKCAYTFLFAYTGANLCMRRDIYIYASFLNLQPSNKS